MPAFDASEFLPLLLPWVSAISLAMARAAGLLLGLPSMTGPAVPRVVQAIATLCLGVVLLGGHPEPKFFTSGITWGVAVFGEFLFGAAIGFVVQLGLALARIAGELAGIEMGLSFAAVADPSSGGQSTAISALFGHLGVQLFIAMGLDRATIRVLSRSVEVTPLGHANLTTHILGYVLQLADSLLETAFTIALPITGGLFCLKLAMAMLARIAPKLQIFTLAFALSIGVGMFLLAYSLPTLGAVLSAQLATWFEHLDIFVS